MIQLAPSVYAADYIHLGQQLAGMEKQGVTRLHIDVMDGNFVPNLAFGPDFVAAIRPYTDMDLDVHLMIREPIRFIKEFSEAGADSVTVHYEACGSLPDTLDLIGASGLKAGLALKPETSLSVLDADTLGRIQLLQIMSVSPGLKGQHFIPESMEKVRNAKQILQRMENNSQVEIEVDGDITLERLDPLIRAGADILVVGKGLFAGSLEERLTCYLEQIRQAGKERAE